MGWGDTDWIHLAQGGCCEYGNELQGFLRSYNKRGFD
jgi:hypothetical protein